MTFEQDKPTDDNEQTSHVTPSSDSVPQQDGDAKPTRIPWFRRRAKRDKTSPAVASIASEEPASIAEAAEDSPSAPTEKFAAAVDEFRKQTPVLLERPEGDDVDDDVESEEEVLNGPTTVGGKVKRFFLSDKLTAALGVTGELLITGGALVLFFLAWQLWINNAIVAGQQAEAVKEFSNNLSASPSASSSSAWTPKPGAIDYGPAPVLAAVGQDAVIGNLYVPRLGSGSTRAVANGVSNPSATFNRGYYGKYEETAWPGEPGNFAMAVHRTGWGTSFTQAQTIRPGDKMYLETPQGWYIYTVRNTEYILPTQVNVLNPMPLSDAPAVAGQSVMTITTCSPMDGNGERLIVYALLSSWQPLEAGIPTEITTLVAEVRS